MGKYAKKFLPAAAGVLKLLAGWGDVRNELAQLHKLEFIPGRSAPPVTRAEIYVWQPAPTGNVQHLGEN